jgi:hypothetical protein
VLVIVARRPMETIRWLRLLPGSTFTLRSAATSGGSLVVVNVLVPLESRTGRSIGTTPFGREVVDAVSLRGLWSVRVHIGRGYDGTFPLTDGADWSEAIAAPLVLAAGEASDENSHSRAAIAG